MIRFLAIVALVALANTAAAETVNCSAQWTKLTESFAKLGGRSVPPIGLIRQRVDGGCATSGITIPSGKHLDVKIAQLSWTGRDMARFVEDGLTPTAFELQLKGLVFIPKTGDPAFEYLQSIQARGRSIDVTLSLDWDETVNELRLERLRISLPEDDFVKLEMTAEGVDLSSQASLQQSTGSFGITTASLTVRSTRMFQDYLLLPLGMELLNGAADPAVKVQELKDAAEAFLNEAPSQVLSSGSKAALAALLDEVPEPSGVLVVEQTSNPGIGVARVMTMAMRAGGIDTPADLWSMLGGITFSITYDPI